MYNGGHDLFEQWWQWNNLHNANSRLGDARIIIIMLDVLASSGEDLGFDHKDHKIGICCIDKKSKRRYLILVRTTRFWGMTFIKYTQGQNIWNSNIFKVFGVGIPNTTKNSQNRLDTIHH